MEDCSTTSYIQAPSMNRYRRQALPSSASRNVSPACVGTSVRARREASSPAVGQGGTLMGDHATDVRHQLRDLLEYLVVDALQDIADRCAGLIVPDAVGVVDVSGAIGLAGLEVSLYTKLCHDGSEVACRVVHARYPR